MLLQYVSGLREESGELSINEILDFAIKIANRCLNRKRIEILRIISGQEEPRTITSTVDEISNLLSCPKSTVWMNVNFLKETGLIENGRGRPVKLTNIGRIMLKNVEKGGESNE